MTLIWIGLACFGLAGALHVGDCIIERVEDAAAAKRLEQAAAEDDLEDWYEAAVEKTFNDQKRPRPTLAEGWEDDVNEQTRREIEREIEAGQWD